MKISLRFAVLTMLAASWGLNAEHLRSARAGKLAEVARQRSAAQAETSKPTTTSPTTTSAEAAKPAVLAEAGTPRSLVESAHPARRVAAATATPNELEQTSAVGGATSSTVPPALLPEALAHKPAEAGDRAATPARIDPSAALPLLGIPTAPVEAAPKYRNLLREPFAAAPSAANRSAAKQPAPFAAGATPPVLRSEPAPKVILNPDVAPPPALTAPTNPVRSATAIPAPTAAPTSTTKPTSSATATPARTEPRTAGSVPAGRSPVIVSDEGREPGAPVGERKMPIGRQPADDQDKKLFEAESRQPTLTPEMELLRKRLQTALAFYYKNWTLNTRDHSPWEVMHAIVAYGVDTRLHKGGPGGPTTTAIGHLCFSGICNNQPILTIRGGKLYALRGPGVQGHSGQFLAILAQSYLQRDYPLYVGGKQFTLEDLIKAEQLDCESGTELTFKLIALMHYLPSDATWVNFQGQTWSLDRLVREEIVQPVRGAACGGTHRLMGLSYAVRKREQRGEPITGVYLEAKKYIDQYHRYTWSLQNRDGSFSTAWFVRPEARNDLDRRLQTTGHTLEWLCFSLSDEQLRDPRVVRSVRYVTDLLLNEQISEWEVGHLGHALHALQMYNERVFGGPVRSCESLVTRKPLKTVR